MSLAKLAALRDAAPNYCVAKLSERPLATAFSASRLFCSHMLPRLRFCLPLLAWLTRAYGLGIPLSSRQPGQFTEFQGRRVGFGSVKEVRVPLAGATIPELEEYLTPERVATAMWDRDKVKSVGDGCYELRMEKLSFVMLDIDSSVLVRVAREPDQPGVISLNSESFSVAAQSPAGTLSTAELGITVRVSGTLQILSGTPLAVGGQVGFETEGDLPGLMMLTPRPVVTAASGGVNSAVMSIVLGEFEKGMTNDFQAWRR